MARIQWSIIQTFMLGNVTMHRNYSSNDISGESRESTERTKNLIRPGKVHNEWTLYIWGQSEEWLVLAFQETEEVTANSKNSSERDKSQSGLAGEAKPWSLRYWGPGPHLNIKTIFPMYGDSHVKDKTVERPSCLIQPGVWDKRQVSEIDLSRTPGRARQAPGVWDLFIPA